MTKLYSLITGASSGIGRDLAYKLASEGHNVILVARREQRLKEIAADIEENYHVSAEYLVQDIGDVASLDDFYEKTKAFQINLWVNNAGISVSGDFLEMDPNDILKMLKLNTGALAKLSILYLQDYADEPVQLLNVSSVAGYALMEGAPLYSVSKHFVSTLTENLAHELANKNKPARAKVLAPAATETEFVGVVRGDAEADVDYSDVFERYHTSEQMAEFAWELLESDKVVGIVDLDDFKFKLTDPQFKYAGGN